MEAVLKRWGKLTRALLIKHLLTGESAAQASTQGLKNKTPKKQGTCALFSLVRRLIVRVAEKDHVHQFPEDKFRYIAAEDKWLKVCVCGLEVAFEKL